jgi:DNA-directed RNA polymerase III subunit RPC7
MRDGPLYTLLEASSMTDEQGHVNERAGFSPFEGMPKYSARYRKARRSIPDLSQMPYGMVYPALVAFEALRI